MTWRGLRLLLLPGLGCVACEPPPDVEPLACRNEQPGVAHLGAGDLETGFQPLSDGDTLPIVLGPQGMHMVVVSLQVEDMERSTVSGAGHEIEVALYEDGEVVGGTVGAMQPSNEEGDIIEFLGIRAIITAAEVEEIADRDSRVEASVVDGCGRELRDALDLYLQL